jgi:formylglycine-generating enzyme required for sulfatase activity
LPRPGRRWFIAVLVVLTLAVTASAFLAIGRRLFPRYWTADDFGPVQVNAVPPPGAAPEGMVWIPGGTFWMGSNKFADAQPIHKVAVDGFWMDRTEVTNEQFAKFVAATGYVTVVERPPDPKKYQVFPPKVFGFQPEYVYCLGGNPSLGLAGVPWGGFTQTVPSRKPFSLVFRKPDRKVDVRQAGPATWWRAVPWACWKRPEGLGSDLKGRMHHPVVHIC